jgi:BT1 family protein
VGYVIQDVVADAMTVEAVPRVDERGRPVDQAARKLMNTTMQTLGRVAVIGGLALVAAINLYVFADAERLSEAEKVAAYRRVYLTALFIPLVSVAGIVLAYFLSLRQLQRLVAQGVDRRKARELLSAQDERPAPDWWILGGSAVFVAFTLGMGFSRITFNQEIVFAGSLAIVAFLIAKLARELEPEARATLIGTAAVVFVYRAIPNPGDGLTWWMIDELKFDQQFLAVLDLIAGILTLVGMFLFRRFMAVRSIAYVVGFLTIVGTVLSLPIIGLYYGLHDWTMAMTGGVVDARNIVIVNTALASPLGQIAMIPMLAWIANSAPRNLKATYFAVMASFSNLALSAGQLGTKYLNQAYVVERQIKDPATGVIKVAADYSQLGELLIVAIILGLLLPFAAILAARALGLKWA